MLRPRAGDWVCVRWLGYPLTQRERIALGLLAQHEALTARELATALEFPSVEALQTWLKRLLECNW